MKTVIGVTLMLLGLADLVLAFTQTEQDVSTAQTFLFYALLASASALIVTAVIVLKENRSRR